MRSAGQSRWRSAAFLAGPLSSRAPDFYARRFGFDVPADALTGKDIAQAVSEDRWSKADGFTAATLGS
jgi:hypothetical protein